MLPMIEENGVEASLERWKNGQNQLESMIPKVEKLGERILSPVRLPVPPSRLVEKYNSLADFKKVIFVFSIFFALV